MNTKSKNLQNIAFNLQSEIDKSIPFPIRQTERGLYSDLSLSEIDVGTLSAVSESDPDIPFTTQWMKRREMYFPLKDSLGVSNGMDTLIPEKDSSDKLIVPTGLLNKIDDGFISKLKKYPVPDSLSERFSYTDTDSDFFETSKSSLFDTSLKTTTNETSIEWLDRPKDIPVSLSNLGIIGGSVALQDSRIASIEDKLTSFDGKIQEVKETLNKGFQEIKENNQKNDKKSSKLNIVGIVATIISVIVAAVIGFITKP